MGMAQPRWPTQGHGCAFLAPPTGGARLDLPAPTPTQAFQPHGNAGGGGGGDTAATAASTAGYPLALRNHRNQHPSWWRRSARPLRGPVTPASLFGLSQLGGPKYAIPGPR